MKRTAIDQRSKRFELRLAWVVSCLIVGAVHCRAVLETGTIQCRFDPDCPKEYPICSPEYVCVSRTTGNGGSTAAGGQHAMSGAGTEAGEAGSGAHGGVTNQGGSSGDGGASGASGSEQGGTAGGIGVAGQSGGAGDIVRVEPGSVRAVLGVMGHDAPSIEAWLGVSIHATGTWTDATSADFAKQSTLADPFADQRRGGLVIDLAGGIWNNTDPPQSWQAAREHAYVDLWGRAIAAMKASWPSELYVAFAHAFNANADSVYWPVEEGDEEDFVAAWEIFSEAFKSQLPESKLVWCPKAGSTTSFRSAFPKNAGVDAVGIEADTSGYATFEEMLSNQPNGIPAAQALAVERGLPLVICHWSVQPGQDALAQSFVEWLAIHAGTEPGQVELAVYDDTVSDCAKQDPEDLEWVSTCKALKEAISPHLR